MFLYSIQDSGGFQGNFLVGKSLRPKFLASLVFSCTILSYGTMVLVYSFC